MLPSCPYVWVAVLATTMLGAAIILPITPPAELAEAIRTGETPIWFAVITCRLPNSTFAEVSEPVLATPSHPMSGPAGGTRGAHALAPQFVTEAEPEAEQAPMPSEDVVIPFSERVTIMELREYMCRWPMGDPTSPDFRFCGARSQTGLPYCSYHSRIAYQPAADRRRDRSKARA